jgi:hypothetical protein
MIDKKEEKRKRLFQNKAKRRFEALGKEFINKTPHEIVVYTELGIVRLEKDGRPVRVEYISTYRKPSWNRNICNCKKD